MLCLGIVVTTIILIILSILLFPIIRIGKIKISSYWVIALIAAIILILTKSVSMDSIVNSFTSNSAVNPVKILVLFISMTILSIFLDEIGFFKFIAIKSTKLLNGSQIKLFLGFYFLISILTIFTSNDIIILTFTPFICYYSKNTKINPLPFLISEFVAANTWSMALIIGNPTNIYLSGAFNITFLDYFTKMILPTLTAAITSLSILLLLFWQKLKEPMQAFEQEIPSPNKFLLVVGLIHLFVTTILLAISSYINLEMWLITISFAISLLTIVTLYLLITKKSFLPLKFTLIRAPWNLIPFVISMFIIVLSLKEQGITKIISDFLGNIEPTFAYGLSGALFANLINNIPMSVLYSNLIPLGNDKALFASIISSNIAAFITPIGALAGIMWMSLLKTYDVQFGFKSFMKYGLIIGIPTLLAALVVLFII